MSAIKLNIMLKKYFIFIILISCYFLNAQSVGIGTTSPSPSAILDVSSTTKGMLVPRMTSGQRTSMPSPTNGLMVYDTDSLSFSYYNGSSWQFLKGSNTNANGWGVNGNAGTTASNFIGTTDAQDLKFRVNNKPFGFFGHVNNNLALGIDAQESITSGSGNIAFGDSTLLLNETGYNNTAIGYKALSTGIGYLNTAVGATALRFSTLGIFNTAVGAGALNATTSGRSNTAIGYTALGDNKTGNENVAIGYAALRLNTTAHNLVAIGDSALYNNTAALYNTAIGSKSLRSNTLGSHNTATGYYSLYSNTTGSNNIAMGHNSLSSNTIGSANVAIGNAALASNTVKGGNVAIGDSALYSNGDGATASFQGLANTAIGIGALKNNTTGYDNTANGSYALYYNSTGYDNTANGVNALNSNTTGFLNTANGYNALSSNTTGFYNTANGVNALNSNTTGSINTANGTYALYYNTTGYYNTANGVNALKSNTTGNYNSANGNNSLYHNSTGSSNTGLGVYALYGNTVGTANTALGYLALKNNENGFYNTALGYNADTYTGTLTNSTSIGANARVDTDNSMVLGSINGINGALADTKVGIGTTAPAERLHVKGIVRIESENSNNYGLARHTGTGGNFHLDTYGTGTIYLNWFSGSGLVIGTGNSTSAAAQFFTNGNLIIGGTLTQSSDVRLKKDIIPIQNSITTLQNINAYTYNWIDPSKDSTLQIGLLSQEVQKYYPQLVRTDAKGMMSVNYSGFVPLLITSTKELKNEVDALKKQNEVIFQQNQLLIKRLEALEKIGTADVK
jgi:trimeric autotransporter adhesin